MAKGSFSVCVLCHISFGSFQFFDRQFYGSYTLDQRRNLYRFVISYTFQEIFDLCIVRTKVGNIDAGHIAFCLIFTLQLRCLNRTVRSVNE